MRISDEFISETLIRIFSGRSVWVTESVVPHMIPKINESSMWKMPCHQEPRSSNRIAWQGRWWWSLFVLTGQCALWGCFTLQGHFCRCYSQEGEIQGGACLSAWGSLPEVSWNLKCGWPKTGCCSFTVIQHIITTCAVATCQVVVLSCISIHHTFYISDHVSLPLFTDDGLAGGLSLQGCSGGCTLFLPKIFWTLNMNSQKWVAAEGPYFEGNNL